MIFFHYIIDSVIRSNPVFRFQRETNMVWLCCKSFEQLKLVIRRIGFLLAQVKIFANQSSSYYEVPVFYKTLEAY